MNSGLALFVLFFLLGPAPGLQDSPVKKLPKPLDAYPDEKSLGDMARWHLNSPSPPKMRPLFIVSFSGNGTTALWRGLSADHEGNAESYSNIWNWAIQRGGITPVGKPKDAGEIRKYLALLERTELVPPLEKVLIVSFKRGDNRETWLYHRDHVPAALGDLWRYLAKGGLAGNPPPPWERNN